MGYGFQSENTQQMVEPETIDFGQYKNPLDQLEPRLNETLCGHLYSDFENRKFRRQYIERRWIKSLYAVNNKYEPSELAKIQRKGVNACDKYVGLTRFKCMVAIAKLYSLLFPGPKKKNWMAKPTPIPDLPFLKLQDLLEHIPAEDHETLKALIENQETPLGNIAQMDFVKKAILDLANVRAENMSKTIHDQLIEAKYDLLTRKMLTEFVYYGTGAFKGVTPDIRIKKQFIPQNRMNGTEWVLSLTEEVVPGIGAPSIWDLYPDAYLQDPDLLESCFQRHALTRHRLRELSKYEEFDKEEIEYLIFTNPKGNYVPEYWESEIDSISGGKDYTFERENTYEVLQYWGIIDGLTLFENFGISQESLIEYMTNNFPQTYAERILSGETNINSVEFQINVWLSKNSIIKKSLNPTMVAKAPYYLIPYEINPKQPWGIGLPEKIEQTQGLINDVMRTAVDNLSSSSGPQIEVNTQLIDDSQLPALRERNILQPHYIWYRSTQGDPRAPMMQFHYTKSILNECLALFDLLRRLLDEESNIPAVSAGENLWNASDMTKTASGMGMMLGEARVVSLGNVKNIDNYGISPLIESLYYFNMDNRYNQNPNIKGDMKIHALGTDSYLVKEVKTKNVLNFLAITNNEIDRPLTKRSKLLREVAEEVDLGNDEFVYTDEELEAMEKKNVRQQEMLQIQMEGAKNELKKQIAEIAKLKSEALENFAQARMYGVNQGQKGTGGDVRPQNLPKQKSDAEEAETYAKTGLINEQMLTERAERDNREKETNAKVADIGQKRTEQAKKTPKGNNKQLLGKLGAEVDRRAG